MKKNDKTSSGCPQREDKRETRKGAPSMALLPDKVV